MTTKHSDNANEWVIQLESVDSIWGFRHNADRELEHPIYELDHQLYCRVHECVERNEKSPDPRSLVVSCRHIEKAIHDCVDAIDPHTGQPFEGSRSWWVPVLPLGDAIREPAFVLVSTSAPDEHGLRQAERYIGGGHHAQPLGVVSQYDGRRTLRALVLADMRRRAADGGAFCLSRNHNRSRWTVSSAGVDPYKADGAILTDLAIQYRNNRCTSCTNDSAALAASVPQV